MWYLPRSHGRLGAALLAALSLPCAWSCGSNRTAPKAAPPPWEETSSDPMGSVEQDARTPAPETPLEFFTDFSRVAASSMNAGGSALMGGGGIQNAYARRLPLQLDTACNPSGRPVSSAGEWLSEKHTGFVPGLFYCILSSEADSNETVLGAMAFARSLLCSLNKAGHEPTFDGSTQSISLTLFEPECWSDTQSQELGPVSATLKLTASSPSRIGIAEVWGRSLEAQTEIKGINLNLQLLFAKREGNTALAQLLNLGNGQLTSVFIIALNTNEGILRYEHRNDGYSAGDMTRHQRIFINGTVSKDRVFSAVTRVEGIASVLVSANRSEGDVAGNDTAAMYTIKGNPKEGYKTQSYHGASGPAGKSVAELLNPGGYWNQPACSGPAGATCAGNEGITAVQEGDFTFILHPQARGYISDIEWFKNAVPLAFSSVTTSASQE